MLNLCQKGAGSWVFAKDAGNYRQVETLHIHTPEIRSGDESASHVPSRLRLVCSCHSCSMYVLLVTPEAAALAT